MWLWDQNSGPQWLEAASGLVKTLAHKWEKPRCNQLRPCRAGMRQRWMELETQCPQDSLGWLSPLASWMWAPFTPMEGHFSMRGQNQSCGEFFVDIFSALPVECKGPPSPTAFRKILVKSPDWLIFLQTGPIPEARGRGSTMTGPASVLGPSRCWREKVEWGNRISQKRMGLSLEEGLKGTRPVRNRALLLEQMGEGIHSLTKCHTHTSHLTHVNICIQTQDFIENFLLKALMWALVGHTGRTIKTLIGKHIYKSWSFFFLNSMRSGNLTFNFHYDYILFSKKT